MSSRILSRRRVVGTVRRSGTASGRESCHDRLSSVGRVHRLQRHQRDHHDRRRPRARRGQGARSGVVRPRRSGSRRVRDLRRQSDVGHLRVSRPDLHHPDRRCAVSAGSAVPGAHEGRQRCRGYVHSVTPSPRPSTPPGRPQSPSPAPRTALSMAPPPAPAPASPPQWQADPHKRHELRYWDGTRWTEHVSNAGVVAVDVVH